MSCTSLKDFVKGIETVLPKFVLMGDVLEACGLKCEINMTHDCQVGCHWDRGQGGMQMDLQLVYGDTEEIAWLQLWDDNGIAITVQAMYKNGVANWSVIYTDGAVEDSPLLKLESDIRTFLGGSKGGDADLHDETTVREIVNMFATFFKR